MDKEFYKDLIVDMPIGFAYHKIVLDEAGKPIDYIYIAVNSSFEEQTGLIGSNIIGKGVKEVLPAIVNDKFDWISYFGDIAINGKSEIMENYSFPLDRWYKVHAFSNRKNHFVTIVIDITKKKKEIAKKTSLITMLNDVVFELDNDYEFTEVIANGENAFLFSIDDIVGKNIHDVFPEDLLHETLPALQNAFILKDAEHFEYYSKKRGKESCFSVQVHYDIAGGFGFYLIAIKDITKEKIMQDEIQIKEEKYRNIFKYAPAGIFHFDENGHIVDCNNKFSKIVGSSVEKIIGLNVLDSHNDFLKEGVKKVLKGEVVEFEGIYESGISNKKIPIHAKAAPVFSNKGEITGGSVIVEDVTERIKNQEQLIFSSSHDFMTRVFNRSHFDEELVSLDLTKNMPLTVVMSDVNGMKLINDSFGHMMGNKLLVEASRIISSCCRKEDIVARIGGDEFAIILPSTDEIQAQDIINNIKEKLSKILIENVGVSISFGYSTKYSTETKMKDILAEAENYMYKRKMYETKSMRNKTIDLIMNALFEKSEREMLHSKRVSEICGLIAKEMGLDSDDINRIKIAGLVHDIGKIGVSEKILNKKGKLDDEEWFEIKKHSEASWRILASSIDFSELAKDVLYHHERWDGKGYPEGLRGEEIPIQARIISIADSYDAMTSDRPYRKGMTKKKTIDEIKKCSGTQFDPKVADVFLKKIAGKIT